jgi:hypothetical protein
MSVVNGLLAALKQLKASAEHAEKFVSLHPNPSKVDA